MRGLFLISMLVFSQPPFFSHSPFSGNPDFINPTGTYILPGIVKNNHVTTHSGELRVRLIDPNTAAICFYINKGFPGYESGAFLDTLTYEDNRIYYTPPGDTSCSLLFSFLPRTVEMVQIVSDLYCTCGFRPGVLVPATFEKSSNEIPIIQDLSGHGTPPTATLHFKMNFPSPKNGYFVGNSQYGTDRISSIRGKGSLFDL